MTTKDEILALLDESTKRAEAATGGPWELRKEVITRGISVRGKEKVALIAAPHPERMAVGVNYCTADGDVWQTWLHAKDGTLDFIAAARTDLPARDEALAFAAAEFDALKAVFQHLSLDYLVTRMETDMDELLALLKGGAK